MADHHPDHNTIASFRKDNAQAIQEAFVQVLLLANKLGMLKVGMVSVDGTHLKANASLNRNVRYDRALQLIAKLDADIAELLANARSATDADSRALTKRRTTTQAYNAQAAVDADGSLLILSASLTQSNDKKCPSRCLGS